MFIYSWIMVTVCGGHATTCVVNQSPTRPLLIKGVSLNLLTRSEFFNVHFRSHSKLIFHHLFLMK